MAIGTACAIVLNLGLKNGRSEVVEECIERYNEKFSGDVPKKLSDVYIFTVFVRLPGIKLKKVYLFIKKCAIIGSDTDNIISILVICQELFEKDFDMFFGKKGNFNRPSVEFFENRMSV